MDPKFIEEVLVGGHYWAPKWEMPGLFHNHEDDPNEVHLVVDILDMWSFIESGYKRLSKEGKELVAKEAEPFGEHVQFIGFDGNNEATYMSIAGFLIDQMNRFSEFKGRELNSHVPIISTYKRMLSLFEPMRKTLIGIELNSSQIIELLKTKQGHPQRQPAH